MIMMASQITSLTVVYSIVYSDADQRKHQSSMSLAFVWVIHRGVTIRRATIRYVSRYVGRDTTNGTIYDDTPTNLESQTHFS